MDFVLDTWIKEYESKLHALFGPRLQCIGLQGSYGRGEATDTSDIDMVVILDQVSPADLTAYGAMLDTLPHREKACGFIAGRQEITHWERSDLFQFYHDTTPLYGSIDYLSELISKADIHRTIRIGACNIYHMCGHNMVHEKNPEILQSLYKTAAFTIQAICYDQTGTYIKRKADLLPMTQPPEQTILQTGIQLKTQPAITPAAFTRFSALLFNWASAVITRYKPD